MGRKKSSVRNKVTKETPNNKVLASNNKTRQDFNEELTIPSSSCGSKRKSNQLKANDVEILIEETNEILNHNKRPKKVDKGQNI